MKDGAPAASCGQVLDCNRWLPPIAGLAHGSFIDLVHLTRSFNLTPTLRGMHASQPASSLGGHGPNLYMVLPNKQEHLCRQPSLQAASAQAHHSLHDPLQ